jgi:hypothetical protein
MIRSRGGVAVAEVYEHFFLGYNILKEPLQNRMKIHHRQIALEIKWKRFR